MSQYMRRHLRNLLERRDRSRKCPENPSFIIGILVAIFIMSGAPSQQIFAAESGIEFEDPSYLELYNNRKGYYLQDPKWIEATLAGTTWPKAGQRVPDLSLYVDQPTWTAIMRKIADDAQNIGLKYNINVVSNMRRNQAANYHIFGDFEIHASVFRPERVDPSEYVVSRAYGLDYRNYGEWINKQYDEACRLQTKESDRRKRLEYVQKTQKVLADDLYIAQLGWGPGIIEAYNSEAWDGVVQTTGFGVCSSNLYWSFLNMKPKTSRNRLIVGCTQLDKSTNIISASSLFRAVGRMIYDRLAFMDKDLKIIPWAAESWTKVDAKTWDVKLRGGMKFHDGKPVTVDDLKFTFDWLVKYDRGNLYSANSFLERTDIVDRANRVVRFYFKEPYGQFETYFLLLNVILPKHIWENILEEQKAGDDPRKLNISHPIGSGPFKFAHHKQDTEMLLVANKEHFSAPKLGEILYVVVPSLDGILGRLENQEIDMRETSDEEGLTPSQIKQLEKSKHLSIVRTKDMHWLHLVPMISRLPWRDYEFRRAWQHSLDRNFAVQSVWGGSGRVPTANTFFTDNNPWHNANLPAIPKYDLNLSRKILKDAGYSWDREGRLLYPPPTDKRFIERVRKVSKEGYQWGGIKMQPLP